MKLSKTEFKQMLKECIMELVKEGKIFGSNQLSNNPALQEQIQFSQNFQSKYVNNAALPPSPNQKLNELAKNEALAIAKGNEQTSKLYQKIFEDTAYTTLQERLANDKTGMSARSFLPATSEQVEQDMKQLQKFDGSNRWATIAFGGAKALSGKLPGKY